MAKEEKVNGSANGQTNVIEATDLFQAQIGPISGPDIAAEDNLETAAFSTHELRGVLEKNQGVIDVRSFVLGERGVSAPTGEGMELFELFHLGGVRSGAMEFFQTLIQGIVDLIDRALMAASLPSLAKLARKVGEIASEKIGELAAEEGFSLTSFRSLDGLTA